MFKATPRASGYLRTGYARGLRADRNAHCERVSLAIFVAGAAAFPAGRFGVSARSRLPGLSRLDRRAVADAADRLCGQISLGHAGLLAAGAFTVGILFQASSTRRSGSRCPLPRWSAACSAIVFGLPSLRLRGLYLAVSTLALHFVVIYLGGEYETKRGFSTGIMIDPPTHRRLRDRRAAASGISSCWRRRPRLADLPQPAAQPHRTRLARDPRSRDRR